MPRPAFVRLPLMGSVLLALSSACAVSGSGSGGPADVPVPSPEQARRARSANRSQAIDPYDASFREHSWLCTLCPAAPPERYPDGCAAGQTGFALRFRPSNVSNPRPVILVPPKDLAVGYEADLAQPVPDFMKGRTFELTEFQGNRAFPVFITVGNDWVSFCSASMDEVVPEEKKGSSRADP